MTNKIVYYFSQKYKGKFNVQPEELTLFYYIMDVQATHYKEWGRLVDEDLTNILMLCNAGGEWFPDYSTWLNELLDTQMLQLSLHDDDYWDDFSKSDLEVMEKCFERVERVDNSGDKIS